METFLINSLEEKTFSRCFQFSRFSEVNALELLEYQEQTTMMSQASPTAQ